MAVGQIEKPFKVKHQRMAGGSRGGGCVELFSRHEPFFTLRRSCVILFGIIPSVELHKWQDIEM